MAATPAEIQKKLKELAKKFAAQRQELSKARAGLTEAELAHLVDREWALSEDDVLWRRTKLGLHLSAAERATVAQWCAAHWPPVAAQADAGQLPIEERAWS